MSDKVNISVIEDIGVGFNRVDADDFTPLISNKGELTYFMAERISALESQRDELLNALKVIIHEWRLYADEKVFDLAESGEELIAKIEADL